MIRAGFDPLRPLLTVYFTIIYGSFVVRQFVGFFVTDNHERSTDTSSIQPGILVSFGEFSSGLEFDRRFSPA
jgi:hypothetical protein